MGLFNKKFCDVCGEKIGLLGNRKLSDGNLCKDCAKKLSPWFEERRQATVDEIKEQLAYREENKAAVAAFRTSRTLGRHTKVLLDETAGLFMVTAASNLTEANPDVLKLADVTGCDVEIDEHRRELYHYVKAADGSEKRESYSPKRYQYAYDFNIIIYINHPWFSQIKFQLNSGSVDVDYREPPVGLGGVMGMMSAGVRPGTRLLEGSTMPPPEEVRLGCNAYAEYEAMAYDIQGAILGGKQTTAAAVAPKQKVACPACGAATFPDANGCCEFCGTPVQS